MNIRWRRRWWRFTRTRAAKPRRTAPIVGTGFNSTVLHYNKLDRRIEDGDIVLLDVAGQYSGYASDITRTIPANGKFTPRQREIYEIVLGAQNAAMEALKPGMTLGGKDATSLQKIAMDYIDSHGKDKEGHSLGPVLHSRPQPPRGARRARSERAVAAARAGNGHHASSRGFTFPRKISACASRTTCSSRRPAINCSPRACRARSDEIEKIMADGKAEREKHRL